MSAALAFLPTFMALTGTNVLEIALITLSTSAFLLLSPHLSLMSRLTLSYTVINSTAVAATIIILARLHFINQAHAPPSNLPLRFAAAISAA